MKNDNVLAVRAIAGTFARQLLLPVLLIAIAVVVIFWIALLFLVSQVSLWWLLLLILLIPATLIFGVIGGGLWFGVSKLTPPLTERQKTAAKHFVERTGTYSNIIGMSRYLIAFHIVRQVIQKKPKTYVTELIGHSTELRDDFYTVRDEFEKRDRKVVENLAEK